jgi:hypothetical protein
MCYTNEKSQRLINVIAETITKQDIINSTISTREQVATVFDNECARIERLAERVYLQSKSEEDWNEFIQRWIMKNFRYLSNILNRHDDYVCPGSSTYVPDEN